MTRKQRGPGTLWLNEYATKLVERIGARGMTLSHEAAKALLIERHRTASQQLGISERSAQEYLDDATLDALAEDLVATFADEEPGGDLFALPRTAPK